MKRILAGVTAMLLLAGCSGAGIGGGASTAPSAPVLFWAPQAGMSFAFTWSDTGNATQYRLLEDPDGHSGYAQIASLSANVTAYTLPGLPLLRRLNARYILRACNSVGCTDSAPVHITGNLAEAVGALGGANTEASDELGYSLALSNDGSTFAVGAFGEDSGATGVDGTLGDNSASGSGAVYVFTRTGNAWNQQAFLKSSNPEPVDFFGESVALSGDGNTLAVGAYAEDSGATGVNGNQGDDSAAASGAVYVFTRSGSSWSQQAYVKASNTEVGDQFGGSVALSDDGNTLAVSAINEDSSATGVDGDQGYNAATDSGAVYVFARDGGAWNQQAYLKAANTAALDGFGGSLALAGDGSTLAVGAAGEDGYALDSGAVHVFTRTGNTWSQQAYLKASNTGSGDNFGHRVAISRDGGTLAASAWNEDSSAAGSDGTQLDDGAADSGAVYVFARSAGNWIQQAYLKASNAEADDNFGSSLSMSADGNTLAAGAWHESSRAEGANVAAQNDNTFGQSGAVYVFTRGASTWSQLAYVKIPQRGAAAWFGRSVALSGNGMTLAVGADGGNGKAFLY